ncbi:2-oxo-4-hydroxy-4-carboxy-5-ureidoimidazoline decarboxylase [Paenibacillus tengchongensis]|uniref:2-oxo-4-hydroxy-4-carboxy-5-ureidoimidazoline decarboxylase n=1 Tax=Paenibacillus tengchongensis TaxID=2608684 RepID=UPI00124EFCA4|nr:2-oxo-4-hydroxy-4-carboxy-5-ureidoimidazoline decarboxylase [Paenibacillus tengchongensis]
MTAQTHTIALNEINAMDEEEFTEALGGIFEHSPWVARGAYALLPAGSVEELHRLMLDTARGAEESKITELLRAHPDLATRMQVTPLSAAEQTGAGLNRLTPEEFAHLTEMNAQYMQKFGFPFILAVRGKNKDDIIAAIGDRVKHSYAEEREQALAEIGRITRFRLLDLITEH